MVIKSIKSIKGTNSDIRCRDFQFEIGKTYSVTGGVRACGNGFHACPIEEHPFSVFDFYPPAGSRYWEVSQSGKPDRDGSKLASASITLTAEITLHELIGRAVKWVFDRADWKNAEKVVGDGEGATASGEQGAATASGTRGAATASGYQGAATASGTRGAATASGEQGAATASGWGGRVSGTNGSALFLVERDSYGNIVAVWAGIAGRGNIKADTFYKLVGGKPVEVQ